MHYYPSGRTSFKFIPRTKRRQVLLRKVITNIFYQMNNNLEYKQHKHERIKEIRIDHQDSRE